MTPSTAGLTLRRAATIAFVVACAVYVNSVFNGWAGDDSLIIPQNARVHSIQEAIAARFLPYWPPPWERAGLYRPFTILTYAFDWAMAGGSPWIFHAVNVLLHALVTALVVFLLGAWFPPVGALVAGLVYAVHPVHVEAVSNVVGRAELLAAAGIFGAILSARRFRSTMTERAATSWFLVTLLIVAVALLSKEHAAIAIAALLLDYALAPRAPTRRSSVPLYLGVAAVTITWFYVWRAVVGPYVASGATTAFHGMSRTEQVMTMLPVQLDILRLLVWPMDLVSDYSQQTIAMQSGWTAVGLVGAVSMLAVILLAFALVRREPALAFAVLLAAGSYLPTSNLLFTSGVVLAERALYIAVLAPAAVAGWLVIHAEGRPWRRALVLACVVLLGGLAIRTWSRTPIWKTPLTTIIDEGVDHQENYRGRIHLGDMLAAGGDTARALGEYLAAASLAENDPFVGNTIVKSAIALRRYPLAVQEAERVHTLAPDDSRTGRWLAEARMAAGAADAAVRGARADAARHPGSEAYVRTYADMLADTKAPAWRRQLADVMSDWINGRLIQVRSRLDSVGSAPLAPVEGLCEDLRIAQLPLEALVPELLSRLRGMAMPCLLPERGSRGQ